MKEDIDNAPSRDLVFTSLNNARRFGYVLLRAGFKQETTDLRRQCESATLSEQDSDTLVPPAIVRDGQLIEAVLRDLVSVSL